MDQSLRITVGNEMYFDGSHPRSPRDDPRSRLGPRMEGLRYDERLDDPYRRPPGPPPPHFDDRRPWGAEPKWGRPHSPRSMDPYLPSKSDRPHSDHYLPPKPDRPHSPKRAPDHYLPPKPDRPHSPKRPPDHYLPPKPDKPHSPKRPSDQYFPPRSERPRYGDGRNYHPEERWPPEKIQYDPDLHGKYPEKRNRSPSPRGRSPYRKRTPSPYSSYGKMRHRSGSRSRSPPSKRSFSPHQRAEELISSVYGSRKESAQSRDDDNGKGALDSLRESYNYDKGDAGRQGYFNERKPKKFAADDEEAFLYGDDVNSARYLKESSSRDDSKSRDHHTSSIPSKPAVTKSKLDKKEALTPGGFDTNALKNVLKAIGFDFELSAQSLQKAATAKVPIKGTAKQQPSEASSSKKPESLPEIRPSLSKTPTTSDFVNPNQIQLALQAGQYIPQNILQGQDPSFFLNQAAMQYSASMGISPSVAQQMLYQPGLAQSTVVPLMQTTESLPLTVPDRPNLKVVQTVSLDDKEKKAMIKSAKTLEEEKRKRKKRLDYLEVELKSLKKKQNGLNRKIKKQGSSDDREQMRENSAMQIDIKKQIKDIREAAERAAGIRSDASSDAESDDDSGSGSSSSDDEPNYFDGGVHLCRECNIGRSTLAEYLHHLHSKSHKKLMDSNYKPWYKPIDFNTKPNTPQLPMKGAQFLLPVNGYYCRLCRGFTGDVISASEHCKTRYHNQKYAKFCKKNPDYAKQEKAAIANVAERLKKLKQMHNTPPSGKKKSECGNPKYTKDTHKAESSSKNVTKDQSHKKEEKYFNDRKPQYMKPKYSPEREKGREFGPELPYKSGYSKKYHPDDPAPGGSSRSSSHMQVRSPMHSKDPKTYPRKPHDKPTPKYYHEHDDLRSRQSSNSRSSSLKRSHSPVGRLYSDRKEADNGQYRYPEKRRFEDTRKVIKDEKKNVKQRKSTWSPGYDELEERRETSEQKEKPAKKEVSPDTNFGKFTWKRVDKSKAKKPATSQGDENNHENKFSLKIEPKSNSTVPRQMKNRSGFGTFAPHTKVVTSQRQDSESPQNFENFKTGPRPRVGSRTDDQKTYIKPNLTKKPIKPVPPPSETERPRITEVDKVVKRRKSFEPPPPGTESTEDIFQGSDDEDIGSDASGISMEIGSDEDN